MSGDPGSFLEGCSERRVYQGNAREGEVEVKTPGAQRVRAAEAAGTHARRPTCLDIITLIGAEHRNSP